MKPRQPPALRERCQLWPALVLGVDEQTQCVSSSQDARRLARVNVVQTQEDARYADTSAERFAELYRLHRRGVYRFVRSRVSDESTAEDVTAETFFKALTRANTFNGTGSYRSWLFKIAQNAAHDSRVRRSPLPLPSDAGVDPPDTEPSPVAISIAREERAAVRSRVHSLPFAQREAISLHYFEERSVRDVARICGKSEEAIRSLLHRARRRLRKEL